MSHFIFDGDYVLMAEDGSVNDRERTLFYNVYFRKKNWVNNHAHKKGTTKNYSCKSHDAIEGFWL